MIPVFFFHADPCIWRLQTPSFLTSMVKHISGKFLWYNAIIICHDCLPYMEKLKISIA